MTSSNTTCSCSVRGSGPFKGWNDYDEFKTYIDKNTNFDPSPVVDRFSNVGLVERWYRCRNCSCMWRLVEPDPPFAGIWERVQDATRD